MTDVAALKMQVSNLKNFVGAKPFMPEAAKDAGLDPVSEPAAGLQCTRR